MERYSKSLAEKKVRILLRRIVVGIKEKDEFKKYNGERMDRVW